MRALTRLLFFSSALFSVLLNSAALDTINTGQALRDNDMLVLAGETYELGFFSPGNSNNRYLGIWFKKISPQTVVWVANRKTPLTSTTGVLKVNSNGMLLLFSGNNTVIWSSNSSVSLGNAPVVAKLLDPGNLVVCDDSSTDEDFVWQSFDHPTDTLLAGMKFGKDLVTGVDRYLTSWKSMDDPSPGLYVS
ncbi:putative bulb-type lectin domain-containing protein [Helianthus annuus]|uniref:Bulb-type lectin domain-containing protein n=1 Tax=Helianthus annuus TaxID=4232 RepID=A0A9K3HA21_HELAN|nr:G-type lectin S-receptor-like serine/threonine-protein kinase At4g27290 [Helianthus annuus]KAF5770769.1 putative bulb-type lectin domain-containing protein [Helianthus annuus]KAJ0465638.1 putative bulb-type lectin domain-containing protein [Helianthus annuus]KAJ0470508.1 putative bulb-type lectin domain-containing protein [Helianthus annuus]KAJ0487231.1 putative bulb-type lectin domain-containing protein [Helianthus annuus]KAJ0661345.1 putative bulb-type lectin domain-containing protein [He